MKKHVLLFMGIFALFLSVRSQNPYNIRTTPGTREGANLSDWKAGNPASCYEAVRADYWDKWVRSCFPGKSWDSTNFVTFGYSYSYFSSKDPATAAQMRGQYSSDSLAAKFLPGVINSGSSLPVARKVKKGQLLYKIVPKGNTIANSPSVYYLSDSMVKAVELNPCLLEQMLGLPLNSVNAAYDVFTIESLVKDNVVFESVIASTRQNPISAPGTCFTTTGGGVQTLILNNLDTQRWKKSTTVLKTIVPECVPGGIPGR